MPLGRLGRGRESVGCPEGWAVGLGYDLQPLTQAVRKGLGSHAHPVSVRDVGGTEQNLLPWGHTQPFAASLHLPFLLLPGMLGILQALI